MLYVGLLMNLPLTMPIEPTTEVWKGASLPPAGSWPDLLGLGGDTTNSSQSDFMPHSSSVQQHLEHASMFLPGASLEPELLCWAAEQFQQSAAVACLSLCQLLFI